MGKGQHAVWLLRVLIENFARSGLDEMRYVPADGDPALGLRFHAAQFRYFDLDGRQTGFYRARALSEMRAAKQHVSRTVDGNARRLNKLDECLESPFRREYATNVPEPTWCQSTEHKLWQGFAVAPRSGTCNLFLAHVIEVICTGDQRVTDYVLRWGATLVQSPGTLPAVALVLRGRQCVGKARRKGGRGWR